jgi:hypothetical protein
MVEQALHDASWILMRQLSHKHHVRGRWERLMTHVAGEASSLSVLVGCASTWKENAASVGFRPWLWAYACGISSRACCKQMSSKDDVQQA